MLPLYGGLETTLGAHVGKDRNTELSVMATLIQTTYAVSKSRIDRDRRAQVDQEKIKEYDSFAREGNH